MLNHLFRKTPVLTAAIAITTFTYVLLSIDSIDMQALGSSFDGPLGTCMSLTPLLVVAAMAWAMPDPETVLPKALYWGIPIGSLPIVVWIWADTRDVAGIFAGIGITALFLFNAVLFLVIATITGYALGYLIRWAAARINLAR